MKHLFFIGLIFLGSITLQAQEADAVNEQAINQVDEDGRKQGMWVIKANPRKHRGYAQGSIVEEGEYKSSRKEGVWKKYYPSGKLRSEITYKSSRPFGPYILYYENGNVEEQSNWARTKNTGSFKRFHENGKLAQDFNFTEGGKRTGQQTYYYENGNKRLEGTWKEGLESGEMKEYYENGDLMAVKNFDNGVMDKDSYESYAPKTPQQDPLEKQLEEGKEEVVKVDKEEQPNIGAFDGNGYKKLVNKDHQISKDGVFKNYRLMDGKEYKYDENGLLIQIRILKNGKYIGDGVIEDSTQ